MRPKGTLSSILVAMILENAVGNIQSFTQRTQRTAEKHREDQEKLDIHDDRAFW